MIGQKLKTFTATDDRGQAVTESDLKGKRSVLWFYPKADTPG